MVLNVHNLKASYLQLVWYSFLITALFGMLDDKASDLGIKSYGVSMTTLEEVFLKLGIVGMKTNISWQNCLATQTHQSVFLLCGQMRSFYLM